MNYKEENKKTYNSHAEEFEERTKNYLRKHIFNDVTLFLKSLPGKRILDLGSGPGRDSLFFKEKGFEPLCYDFSPEMIKRCEEKSLVGKVGEIEKMNFPDDSFDGVWAYTSLLHIPEEEFTIALKKVNKSLVKKGVFYIGMKEGKNKILENERYSDDTRTSWYYTNEELIEMLKPHFDIFNFSKVELENTYLNYLCRKKH